MIFFTFILAAIHAVIALCVGVATFTNIPEKTGVQFDDEERKLGAVITLICTLTFWVLVFR